MAALAIRFPRRRIEFHSGMGMTSLGIKKRGEHAMMHDEWVWSDNENLIQWPDQIQEPAPELWSAMQAIMDSDDGKDPGIGTIIYENGKRIKGLS
jgi:hypothetical protein